MSKIPEFLHLTFKEQVQYIYEEDLAKPPTIKVLLPLAFANVYDPHTKGYQKRFETQMRWAYDRHFTGYTVNEDGVYINEYLGWKIGHEGRITVPAEKVKKYLQPRLIKNDPMAGFKIAHSVSRYSTSNKLWRIEDPRGFELEISTGNMEELLMTGTVTKGVFMGAMQWRTAKQLQWV